MSEPSSVWANVGGVGLELIDLDVVALVVGQGALPTEPRTVAPVRTELEVVLGVHLKPSLP